MARSTAWGYRDDLERNWLPCPVQYQGEKTGDLGFFKVANISRAVAQHEGQLRDAQHYVSLAVAKELKGKPIPPGATVFAKIGEAIKLNRRAYVITECLVDNNVMVVKALLDESDRYVFWFLRTQDFTELSRATTVPSLRKGDIESLVLPLAPLNEQRRIANKLDAVLAWVDACRERLDRVPAILKRFRQAVLAAATSGTLTEEWREDNQVTETAIGLIRRIAEERKRLGLPSAARVIRDEGVEVPETRLPSSWTWCRVGDIGVVPVSLRDM